VLVLAGIDDPKLDNTASHPSSSSQPASPCRLSSRHPAPTIMGGLVLHTVSVHILSFSIGRQSVSVSAMVTVVSEPSVSAVVSVTAITGLQLQCHFWLRSSRSLENCHFQCRGEILESYCYKTWGK